MARVNVQPQLLRWARERAGLAADDLRLRFPKLEGWELGDVQPTLKQLEKFAGAVHVPVGYLFLNAPPNEPLPIPDFRTMEGRQLPRPSPDLLDTIYACQERQSWYREFAIVTRIPAIGFVGSLNTQTPIVEAARAISSALGFDLAARAQCPRWEDALRLFIGLADGLGILVMVSGIVANNTRRTLDPEEFRGFALSDDRAPLIFINGADTKAGQMFTLAHELAHLWLGVSAVSDANPVKVGRYRREEVWCNAVAAEMLVPLDAFRRELDPAEALDHALLRLARQFKVSTLVILRRLLDAQVLSRASFEAAWDVELARVRALARKGVNGGNFYRATLSRVSRRFARALVESTIEGQTLYRDAFRMLGVVKTETFNNLGREVGVPM